MRKYIALIDKIEDNCFKCPSVREDMKKQYRGAKKDLTGESLLQKLDAEMRELCKFAAKFPGFSNPSSLPSGTMQLSHMKIPVIIQIWMKTDPNIPGVDYHDNDSVMSQVPPLRWLEHDSCKCMLAIFIHKDNKDLSLQPTTLQPGDLHKTCPQEEAYFNSGGAGYCPGSMAGRLVCGHNNRKQHFSEREYSNCRAGVKIVFCMVPT